MSKRSRIEREFRRKQQATQQQQQVRRLPDVETPSPQIPRRIILEARAHSGPLPDPRILREYDEVLPGAAQRIIAMGEREQAHRHAVDNWGIAYGFLGMGFGFVIGLTGLGVSAYLGVNGQPWMGGILGGGTLVSLVGTFIYARQGQEKTSQEQNQKLETRDPQAESGPVAQ